MGEEIPSVTSGLQDLANSITAAVTILNDAATALRLAKSAIRVPAVSDFEAQLAAVTGLNFPPVGLYIEQLIQGVETVLAEITSLPPLSVLANQLGATVGIAAGLELKIGLVDTQLAALDLIIDQLIRLITQLAAALRAYSLLATTLAVTGAHAFVSTTALTSLGNSFDSVTPLTGIPGSVTVTAIMLLVPNASVAALNALNATFKVA